MIITELHDAQAQLSVLMKTASLDDRLLTLAAVDEAGKRLVVGVADPLAKTTFREIFRQETGTLPVSIRCVRFRRHGKQQRHRPISGGLKIVHPKSRNVELGTIGVVAKRDRKFGFVTAGHVAESVGTKIYQPRNSLSNLVGETTVVSNFTGTADSDAAFVAFVESSVSTELGKLGKLGEIWKNDGTFYTIVEAGAAQVNDPVIMSGMSNNTGVAHGIVLATGATVQFEDSGTLCNQVVTNYLTEEGDSGSPVFKISSGDNVTLLGINVGGSEKQYITPQPSETPASNGLYGIYSLWSSVKADLGGSWVVF